MSDHTGEASSRVAVIDIDGVLADVRGRLHHIQAPHRDWDAFFAGLVDDPVLAPGRAHVRAAAGEGLAIVYLTGRPERCRVDTVRWLKAHGLPEAEVVMRPDHDRRPARVIKVEALRQLALVREIAYLLDDDPQVCDAARKAGFCAIEATWVDRPSALADAQEASGRS